jgi:hypothetical protein
VTTTQVKHDRPAFLSASTSHLAIQRAWRKVPHSSRTASKCLCMARIVIRAGQAWVLFGQSGMSGQNASRAQCTFRTQLFPDEVRAWRVAKGTWFSKSQNLCRWPLAARETRAGSGAVSNPPTLFIRFPTFSVRWLSHSARTLSSPSMRALCATISPVVRRQRVHTNHDHRCGRRAYVSSGYAMRA